MNKFQDVSISFGGSSVLSGIADIKGTDVFEKKKVPTWALQVPSYYY
jgi:hypothetical protein